MKDCFRTETDVRIANVNDSYQYEPGERRQNLNFTVASVEKQR